MELYHFVTDEDSVCISQYLLSIKLGIENW